MALKFSHIVLITLWLSLLFLFFHELYHFKSSINAKISTKQSSSSSNVIFSSLSGYPLINRKVLASKFDFTPFQKHRQKEHEKSSSSPVYKKVEPDDHQTAADESAEIDPRYGVEKRLVPTGPNPLHH